MILALFGVSLTLFSFFFSFVLTDKLKDFLAHKKVMDKPNDRSMHSVPVPRGGGLAVTGAILLGLIALLHRNNLAPSLWILGALTLLAVISWWDDRKGVKAGVRLVCHLIAAGFGSLALGPHNFIFDGYLPFWADRLIMILLWGWFINLYNFMDGIDGLTGSYTLCCALGVGIFAFFFMPNPLFLLSLCALLIGSCLGFLKFNWHPAQIFLGDVGSVPLGFLVGFMMLSLAIHGFSVAALLLPAYYLADSGITIMRRVLRGEKFWQAHRQHFYQCATIGVKSPVPVVYLILTAQGGLVCAALLSANNPWLALALGVIITGLLLARLSHCATLHKK